VLDANEIFDLELFTEKGQKKILKATEVFNKMIDNLSSEEIQIIADFENEFQFGTFDLFQAKLKEVKPELFE
jgi:hypothetical protein